MKPTIETSRIRSNLRLAAELGHIPTELVPVIERSLGLDYVESEFKKKYKNNIQTFGKRMADLLDHYDLFISTPHGKWEIVGNGVTINCGGYSFNAQTFMHLKEIEEKNKRVTERVAATPIVDGVHQITVAEVKAIVAEENGNRLCEIDECNDKWIIVYKGCDCAIRYLHEAEAFLALHGVELIKE